MQRDMEIKVVEWNDATQKREVKLDNTYKTVVAKMRSVGFVLHEDDTQITLVRDVFEGGLYRKAISIPKSAISNMYDKTDLFIGPSLPWDRITRVEWVDYTFNYDGVCLEEDTVLKNIRPRKVTSVGFLESENKLTTVLYGDLDVTRNVAKYLQVIPKSGVVYERES